MKPSRYFFYATNNITLPCTKIIYSTVTQENGNIVGHQILDGLNHLILLLYTLKKNELIWLLKKGL